MNSKIKNQNTDNNEIFNIRLSSRIKNLRKSSRLTLDQAEELTGVSKPMLSQIERGQSIPTISTLFKIASGFKIPLSKLLEEERPEYELYEIDKTRSILDEQDQMQAFPLFPYDEKLQQEIFLLEFEPGCVHESRAHLLGTEEIIIVIRGELSLAIESETIKIPEGGLLRFNADIPHTYQNLGNTICEAYNIIYYRREF